MRQEVVRSIRRLLGQQQCADDGFGPVLDSQFLGGTDEAIPQSQATPGGVRLLPAWLLSLIPPHLAREAYLNNYFPWILPTVPHDSQESSHPNYDTLRTPSETPCPASNDPQAGMLPCLNPQQLPGQPHQQPHDQSRECPCRQLRAV